MVNSIEIKPMLTVREVAHLIHVHANTVRRWSDRGIIKAYRITSRGDRRYRLEDVSHFITELTASGGDERKVVLNQE